MLKINFNNPIIHDDMLEINDNLPEREMLYKKRIYISGASGMIASYLIAYFIWLNEKFGANIQIYAGIRNKEKAISRFDEYLGKDYFHLLQSDVLESLPEELCVDYIIHAASLASPQYYGKQPVETMLPNTVGTVKLLEFAKKHSIKGFLFFSSGAVYGSIKGNTPIAEHHVGVMDFLTTGNMYGESKRCGEALCRAYAIEYALPVKIARIIYTYSPTADIENDARVFSEFAGNIVKNQDIVLKSTGQAKRPFCYITDTITGLLKVLLIGNSGEVYNIANPDEFVSIYELAKILEKLFSYRNLKVIRREREDSGYSSSLVESNPTVNVDKLRQLGWNSNVSIEEGFQRMINAIEF